ncbi:hypothetical protein [Pseudonocardia acaciae]|uniref:hypothetical protein n=1 Tax=Pseudonocardia acaciae TaxID=551276 RepID=UPI001B80C474|nr:hypothetical protein [Pseudonocardia acaciae]
MTPVTGWLRAGVGLLAAVQVVVGAWALFLPASFFSLEVVGMGMAYNEHLMRDYGAMTLASAVVLGAATVHTGSSPVALTMYLTWAVPHFVIHLTMLDHLSPSTGALLMTALGLAIALPTALLALTVRGRTAPPRSPSRTSPVPRPRRGAPGKS